MLLYPKWYDPCRDRLCDLPVLIDHLEALARAWREDQAGYDALNMRLWKRAHLQAFFRALDALALSQDLRAAQHGLGRGRR